MVKTRIFFADKNINCEKTHRIFFWFLESQLHVSKQIINSDVKLCTIY